MIIGTVPALDRVNSVYTNVVRNYRIVHTVPAIIKVTFRFSATIVALRYGYWFRFSIVAILQMRLIQKLLIASVLDALTSRSHRLIGCSVEHRLDGRSVTALSSIKCG